MGKIELLEAEEIPQQPEFCFRPTLNNQYQSLLKKITKRRGFEIKREFMSQEYDSEDEKKRIFEMKKRDIKSIKLNDFDPEKHR